MTHSFLGPWLIGLVEGVAQEVALEEEVEACRQEIARLRVADRRWRLRLRWRKTSDPHNFDRLAMRWNNLRGLYSPRLSPAIARSTIQANNRPYHGGMNGGRFFSAHVFGPKGPLPG